MRGIGWPVWLAGIIVMFIAGAVAGYIQQPAAGRLKPAPERHEPGSQITADIPTPAPDIARQELVKEHPGRGDWWMLGHDARHTGRSAFCGPKTATLKWKFRSTGRGDSCNTVALGADGAVYTTAGAQVIALEPGGRVRWSCERSIPLGAPVLAKDGTLYVIEQQRNLVAFSTSGQLQWSYEFPGRVYCAPQLGPDGNIYVGCTDGILYVINPRGQLAWQYAGGEFFTSGPLLGSDGLSYFLDPDGNLFALDRNGKVSAKHELALDYAHDLSGDPGPGFALAVSNGIAELNRDGSLRWQYEFPRPKDGSYLSSSIFCELAVRKDGAVFFANSDGIVFALSPWGKELWRYKVKGQVWAKPLILPDGSVMIFDESGLLSTLDPGGRLRWDKQVGPNSATHATAVLGSDANIYVSGGGVLYALRSDGTEAWTYATVGGGGFVASPLLAADGTVYAVCIDSMLYALNPGGKVLWQCQLEALSQFNTPALTKEETLLLPAGNRLIALRPGGVTAWTYDAGSRITTSPTLDDKGLIYLGTDDGRLLALKPRGKFAWAYQTQGRINMSSPAIGKDGRIYVGTELALDTKALHDDGRLYAIKPNGKLAWTFAAGSSIWSSPVVADDGTVYIANSLVIFGVDTPAGTAPPSGRLFALTPEGKEKWSYPLLSRTQGTVVLGADRTVYIGSWDGGQDSSDNNGGQLYAFNPEGRLLWQGPYSCLGSPCVGADGTIYSSAADSKLYALQPGGHVLWSYQMAQPAANSPVIGADGTLYVGSSDGYLYAFHD